jgi:hypothetical protein
MRRALVEPLAGSVDDDRPAQIPLGASEVGATRGGDRRNPPGIVHKGHSGAESLAVLSQTGTPALR